MEAYLDNSATTQCSEEVIKIVEKTMREDYGNPSSKHLRGVEAERYLKDAREEIAKTLKVSAKEIFFTSGGTESDNWAVIGAAMANKRAGNHIITTSIEHAAILQPMAYLEEQGFRVTYLPVDRQGLVDLKAYKAALCPETILVSAMFVNNEIGTREPIEEMAKIAKEYNPNILFHTDAIQAYGKYRIYPKKIGVDMLSVSGHKIHGPKGTGFLYIGEKVKIKPLILGGGQQMGMRSGTDNVPGIAGLGVAATEAYLDFDEKIARLSALKERLIAGVREIEGTVVQGQAGDIELAENGHNAVTESDLTETGQTQTAGRKPADDSQKPAPKEPGAPHIVSVSFRDVRSEVLLHALEDKGVYVSSGSACSSNKKLPVSTVLKEIGVEKPLLESTVRFSFSTQTTEEEIDYALEQLRTIVPMLRKYRRH